MTRFDHLPAGPLKAVESWGKWFAGALAACTMLMAAPSEAEAQSRTLKLYHVHNRERVEITYRRGNSYDPAALKKLNMFFRDWRKNQPTKMDPKLFDVLWEVYRRTGAKGEIQVIGGYRSPATNSMLRSRSKGVAKNSQHTMGRAIDFFIPGVPLKTLRNAGLQLQAGGVGYYPSSGSPFVHMDVGNVRHWPRIGQSELASIMSKGSKMSSGGTMIAAASPKRSGGFLSAFFGRGAEEEDGESVETAEETPAPKPAARKPAQPVQTAKSRESLPGIEVIPPDRATPAVRPAPEPEPAPVEVVETPETIIAALPARKVPLPAFAPRPQANVGAAVAALNDAVEAPTPADMPFAVKPAEEPAQDVASVQEAAPAQEVALGIPLPSWRPEHKPAQPDADASALLAMAATEVATDAAEIAMPMPTERPAVTAAAQERVAKPAAVAAKAKPSAVVTTASVEPVKTTRKDARPTRVASKPTPKPVVVAAPPASARWAIDESYVSAKTKTDGGTSHAYNVVRTAPLEVYTAGFQQGRDAGDMNRFSGKAVEFLSVAKFK